MKTLRFAAALLTSLFMQATALFAAPHLVANLALGAPAQEGDRQFVIPVIVTTDAGSVNPQAFSFRIVSSVPLANATVQHSGFTEGQPAVFEWQSNTSNTVSYVVFYDETVVRLPPGQTITFAELHIVLPENMNDPVTLTFESSGTTMVSARDGVIFATQAKGTLSASGLTIDPNAWYPPKRRSTGR
jgi:hypothetical protein